jgi:perosamine synthetase
MSIDFWHSLLKTEHLAWVPRLTAGIYAVAKVRGARRVLLPNNCCPQLVYAILLAGAEPIFCEVDLDNGGLDVHACEALMRRSRVDLVIHVHLYGLYDERQVVFELCRRYGAFFFEDAGLWFPPLHGYEILENSCLGLSFGDQKIFDFGGGGVLAFMDRSMAAEVQTLIESLPPRPSGTSTYGETYAKLVGPNGLPKRRGTDFSVFAERYRDYWIGSRPIPPLPIDRSRVHQARESRITLSNTYRGLLSRLGVQFFVEHPLDMPWRFSFLSHTARRFGVASSTWYPPLHAFFPKYPTSPHLDNSCKLGEEVCNLRLDHTVNDANILRLELAIQSAQARASESPFGRRLRGSLGFLFNERSHDKHNQ